MTPQEKANQLIKKFSPLVTTWDCYNDTPCTHDEILVDAKKCALIAVEEILELDVPVMIGQDSTPFWQEVRNEINKL